MSKTFLILLDKDIEMERDRDMYEYQQESPPHQMHSQQPQTVHLTPNHPHLRHVGHPQTSIICVQQPHSNQQSPATLIASNSPSHSVQNHTSQPQHPQSMSEIHEIQLKKEALHSQTHFQHHQSNGEIRPSVIESNQPMVIECT